MDLYFRSDTLELVTNPTFLRAPTRVELVRGDTPDLVVRFVDPATFTVVDAFGTGSTWLFSAKTAADFGSTPLTSTTGVTRTGTGATTKYVLSPNLNATPLNTALGVGTGTELAYVDTDAQFEITYAGKVSSTAKFTLRVNNDVARGTDPLTNDASNSPVVLADTASEWTITPTICYAGTSVAYRVFSATIPENRFDGATDITSAKVGTVCTTVGANAFSACASMTALTLPESLTTISASSFDYCVALEALAIPFSVTSIGSSALAACSALESLTFPDSTSAQPGASSTLTALPLDFCYNCSALTTVTLPPALETIAAGAFYGCSSLTAITFPGTITSIGDTAFFGTGLTAVTLPTGTTLGTDAFPAGCTITYV